jgi:phosphoribosylamine--glycine ligase
MSGTGMPQRVLVVGNGARQHALAWRFAADGVAHVAVAPGNPLMADVAELHSGVSADDLPAVVELARSTGVDLVVVGPEDPLVAGLADELAAAGIACFGPRAAAARLEGSKAFARSICDAAGVQMATGRSFTAARDALEYAESLGLPVVVKADGLAEGKGVVVCATLPEAEQAIRDALERGRFGSAGETVVVEAWLRGTEASVFALGDGEHYALLPAARDHKRVGEGDTGPNTGGMGAYSPVAEIEDAQLAAIGETIVAPVLRAMAERGTPFRGALFAGLMLTPDGPRVLEFNVRFGDPETQAIVPRLAMPLAGLLLDCATGSLRSTGVLPALPEATVALALAAAGYPLRARRGDPITGIDNARANGTLVFGAGVARRSDGALVTAGGRVLTVVGRGPDVASAAEAAYSAADLVEFEGRTVRRDIGRAPLAVAG